CGESPGKRIPHLSLGAARLALDRDRPVALSFRDPEPQRATLAACRTACEGQLAFDRRFGSQAVLVAPETQRCQEAVKRARKPPSGIALRWCDRETPRISAWAPSARSRNATE